MDIQVKHRTLTCLSPLNIIKSFHNGNKAKKPSIFFFLFPEGESSMADKIKWLQNEIDIMYQYLGVMPINEFQEKYLPNRTPNSIMKKAHSLGIALIRSRDWSEEELKRLREHYGKIPNKELQEKYLPNRTPQAIRMKASEFGIASMGALAWTKEDDEILKKYYGKILNEELRKKYLPDRTLQAIWSRASSLGIGLTKELDWTKKEDEILQKHYTDFSSKNTRGNHMYSNALKHYRYFLNATTEDSDDHAYVEQIKTDSQIPETERTAIIQSRIGQGIFRKSLFDKYYGRCIITGINQPRLLVASHIKPWAVSSNKERLSVNNGLLLSATYDRLFDSGLITFDRHGKIFLSSLIGAENAKRLGLSQGMSFDLHVSKDMEEYLAYHNDVLFIK